VRTSALLGAVALLAGSTACSTLHIGSDYDREASFADARTWDWAGVAEADSSAQAVERINPFLDRRLRRAVADELDARGLVRVEEGPVDILVSVSVLDPGEIGQYTGRGESPVVYLGFGFGYNPGYWYSPWGWGYPYYGYPYRYRRYPWYSYGFPTVGVAFGRPYFGYPYAWSGYGYRSLGGYGSRDLALPPGTFIVDVMDGESGDLVWRGWADGALAFAPDADEMPAFIASTIHRIMEKLPIDSR